MGFGEGGNWRDKYVCEELKGCGCGVSRCVQDHWMCWAYWSIDIDTLALTFASISVPRATLVYPIR